MSLCRVAFASVSAYWYILMRLATLTVFLHLICQRNPRPLLRPSVFSSCVPRILFWWFCFPFWLVRRSVWCADYAVVCCVCCTRVVPIQAWSLEQAPPLGVPVPPAVRLVPLDRGAGAPAVQRLVPSALAQARRQRSRGTYVQQKGLPATTLFFFRDSFWLLGML